jgi:competence protein ComEA
MAEQFERYRWLIVAFLSLPLLGSIALLANNRLDDGPPPVIRDADSANSDIRVYVAGAVANPGIYPLEEGSRWADAVKAAGGFSADANHEAINLARRVQDEDHIVVPRVTADSPGEGVATSLININSASESELISLPGIGEARAASIVLSRTQDGPFGGTEDLLVRQLVPDSVYQDIVGLITVSQ